LNKTIKKLIDCLLCLGLLSKQNVKSDFNSTGKVSNSHFFVYFFVKDEL